MSAKWFFPLAALWIIGGSALAFWLHARYGLPLYLWCLR